MNHEQQQLCSLIRLLCRSGEVVAYVRSGGLYILNATSIGLTGMVVSKLG